MSTPGDVAALPKHLDSNPVLSRWVTVREDGTVGLRLGKVEFGQGILTAIAQVAADGLGVPITAVTMLPAHTELGPDQGLTAGSMSVFDAAPAVSAVSANVRALFVAEAARRWQVDPAEVTVTAGVLEGPGFSMRASYGELAGAVDLDVAADPRLARPVESAHESAHESAAGTADEAAAGTAGGYVGLSVARLDLPDKIAGRPRYIHDLRLPGQLFGRVLRPPSPGARLLDAGVTAVDGLGVQVVRDGSFLGVVGEREADVVTALEKLRASAHWEERASLPDEDDLDGFLRAGPHEDIPVVDDLVPPASGTTLRASYSRPFLAHASIAPSCGVARWEPDGRVSIWSHSQGIHRLRDAVAQALDLDPARVTVEHVQGAGCYGHNAADDAAFDAVLLARAVPGRPVQVQWTRRDELAWSPFGSAMSADVEAGVDETGRITEWTYDVWSQGHTARPGYAGVPGLLAGAYLAEPLSYPAATDPPQRAGGGTVRNALPLYDVGGRRVTGHRLLASPIRSSALRALGAFLNVFAIESFMDELAAATGHDPLEYRLMHLADPRARAVLEAAATAGRWGEPTPDGVGRGIGLARYKDKGAYCAVVAEVEADHDIRVRRLDLAVDVGRVLNPDGVRNQIEGGATQATSWTLKERVRFDRYRVTSDDWESYPILRFGEAPEVHVHLVSRPELPSVGSGEAAQGPTAAAIGNAVAAAVGVRVRHLPITPAAVVAAIESEGQ